MTGRRTAGAKQKHAGINGLSEVRKLQNRLSQQRWRDRKRQERMAAKAPSAPPLNTTTTTADSTVSTIAIGTDNTNADRSPEEVEAQDLIDAMALNSSFMDSNSTDEAQTATSSSPRRLNLQKLTLSQLLSIAYCSPSPSQEFYLSAMHFVKAFVQNTRRFGFSLPYVCDKSSASYISSEWQTYLDQRENTTARVRKLQSTTLSLPGAHTSSINSSEQSMSSHSPTTLPTPASSSSGNSTKEHELRWEQVPKNMFPTEEQLTIAHHPYIDIAFPWPSVRAKVIRSIGSTVDYDDLCDALFKAGLPGTETGEPAFYIWGDDGMDPASWEVGEAFALKWWFLLDDEIVRRTNWWRRRRGLQQLSNGPNDSLQKEWLL